MRRVLGATRFVLAARRALRALGPFDRVVAHFIVPSGWPIALGVGCPLEVVGHGSDVRLLLRLPAPMRHAILAGLHSRGAKFRFVSAELRDRLLEGSLRRLRRVSIVEPCPLELPVPPSRNAARSTLGLPADAPLALVVGRLVRSKRPQVALNALSLLPGVQVVVVGDGPLGEGLAAKFPAVRLLGRLTRPETLTWIAAADVLVCTSRREGAPTVVREARRLGTPVVATPWGSLPDCERNDALLTLIASAPTRGGGEQ